MFINRRKEPKDMKSMSEISREFEEIALTGKMGGISKINLSDYSDKYLMKKEYDRPSYIE